MSIARPEFQNENDKNDNLQIYAARTYGGLY